MIRIGTFGRLAACTAGILLIQANAQSQPNPVVRSQLNITPTIKFLSQVGDGTNVTATSFQVIPSQGSLTYYATNTASSIATYLQMTATPFSPKTTLTTGSLTAGTTIIRNFATNAGIPNVSFIPAGVYVWHMHASRTGGSANITLQCQIWEVSSVGVDIALIGTTEATPVLTTSELEYELQFASANVYMMASTASRVVARVQAVVVAGTQTANIFVGGTADTHLSLPSPTVDATNFVPYTGATSNVNLGTFTLTAANSPLPGTTGSIGGGALLAGACASGTVGVTNSTTAMSVVATPVTYPGDGNYWLGYVSAAGTVTVKVCAAVAGTPTASTYNVRVIQ